MIFDTHAHYTAEQFDADRDSLLAALPAQNVCGIIDCGTDYATSLAAKALCETHTYMRVAAGIHPESLIDKAASTQSVYGGDWQRELQDIEALLSCPTCVAVGECGLDYHWPVPKDAQNALFEAHLQMALRHDMPVLVHDREAHADVYALLQKYRPKGIVHCYSGSADDALRLVKQGMYIGFGGALTFKNAKRAIEAAAALPLEAIVLETDCPYMAPEGFRGKRCDSSMIAVTAARLAEIKQLPLAEVLRVSEENARRLFSL